MNFNIAKSFLLPVVLTFIRGRGLHSTHKSQLTEEETRECLTNYYFNGKVCTGCPVGYFGDNCSSACPAPTYGEGCVETCSCSRASCHHVYGCIVTTGHSKMTYLRCPSDPDDDRRRGARFNQTGQNKAAKEEENNEQHHLKFKHIRITIITSGILVSTCLLFLITRKIYKLCRVSSHQGSQQNPSHSPDDDNIYADITEFSQSTS